MEPQCWHATRVDVGEVKCLMLTRRSSTLDLVVHLMSGAPACESLVKAIEMWRLHVGTSISWQTRSLTHAFGSSRISVAHNRRSAKFIIGFHQQ
jgi:hypothetical protein